MPIGDIEFGDSISGLLVDGVEGTPYVGATLRMTQAAGVTVEVPYLPDRKIEQFDHVQAWFDSRTPPSNMLLLTPTGTISLFDIAWSGHSTTLGGARASLGTLKPDLAVLGHRDPPLADALVMKELHSLIDGLNEWSGLSSVRTEPETDDEARVHSVTMVLQADIGVTWRQGNATMTARAEWRHAPERDGCERKITVHDNVAISSTFDTGPAPFWDHFVEQRKVANLMVFLFGRPLSFRNHRLRDDLFARRAGNGHVYSTPLTQVVSRHTYRDQITEVPTVQKLGRPLAYLSDIGGDGLEAWSQLYETWHRFIMPSVSVLGRANAFIEDVIVSTSMSMEAAGGILGERPGERDTWTKGGKPSTATYVFRCLEVLNVRWPERIGNRAGLSRAIADSYNGVKHYDRGDFPDHEESYIVSEIAQMIVRLLAIHITGRDDDLLATYRESDQFYKIKQSLESLGLSVNEEGKWLRDGEESPAP